MRAAFQLLMCGLLTVAVPHGVEAQLPARSGLARETGAVYLEDVTPKELKLSVLKDAPVYSTLDGKNRLGVIPAGRQVTVLAFTDKALRVRGRAMHDSVAGWIPRGAVTALDVKFVDSVNAAVERRKQVAELIEKKEVALGMTAEEVEESLGRPSARSSRVDAGGKVQSMDYITYRNVPRQIPRRDSLGRLVYAIVYVKEETGRRRVELTNGVVSGIEESEQTPPRGNGRIVPPPVVIGF